MRNVSQYDSGEWCGPWASCIILILVGQLNVCARYCFNSWICYCFERLNIIMTDEFLYLILLWQLNFCDWYLWQLNFCLFLLRQLNLLQGNIVDRDSDTSSVNSEDRSYLSESGNSDDHKSLIHRIMVCKAVLWMWYIKIWKVWCFL
jgi:hypothetical protein